MRTLYDRFTQDQKHKLEIKRKDFPSGVGQFIDSMKKKTNTFDLTLNEIISIHAYLQYVPLPDTSFINDVFNQNQYEPSNK